MTAQSLIDTNILLYAASKAPADQHKREIARELLTQPDIGFSAQVLQEFYAVAVSRQRLGMTHAEAVSVLQCLDPITRELVLEAVLTRQRFGVSYWDAAVLVAARQMGCQTLFSEDLNRSQTYDGVTVVNPFVSIP